MTLNDLARLLAPLRSRVLNMVARAVISGVDDSKKLQLLQLGILAGETHDELERFQEYGFSSVPRDGAEAVVIFPGGTRDHGLAIGVEDRRYRIKGLAGGEVAVYNDTGAKIVMRASGDIDLVPKTGQKVKVTGDVDVTGTLTASADVVGGGKSLATHTHSVAGANSGGPVVFVPPALTGPPS